MPRAWGEFGDLFDREDLAGAVGDVADVDDFGAGRDGVGNLFDEVVHRGRRALERHLFKDDAVAAFALLPGSDHAAVVLVGGDDFVAAFQFHAELDNFEGFARVAGDGNFFGFDAEGFGDAAADGLDIWDQGRATYSRPGPMFSISR